VPQSNGRTRPRWIAPVLAIAFLARLAAALTIEVDPRRTWTFDMSWYDRVARSLLAGKGVVGWDGAPTAAWPPGYPLLLALVYSVSGNSLLAAKVCNALLETASVLVTFLIGRELARPRAGLLAAAILAVFPGHVLFSPLILSEALFGFLFCIALWVFLRLNRDDRAAVGRWSGFGVLLGAMSLVRGIAVVLLPAFMLAWLVEGVPRRVTAWRTMAAAIGIAVALVPWTLRNYRLLGSPVLIATDGASSLWVGNSPAAAGNQTLDLEIPWKAAFGRYQSLPNPAQEVEIAKAETREALAYMARNPARVVALIPAKVYYMYRDDLGAMPWLNAGLARQVDRATYRALSLLIDAYYFPVLAMAVLGARHLLPSAGRGAVALPIVVAWLTLVHAVLFFGDDRFHFPLLPLLSLMAASELLAWTDRARRRAIR
jgi:4-amino-4-deoxy-L-arabinose transferase-like glycosyltransferase